MGDRWLSYRIRTLAPAVHQQGPASLTTVGKRQTTTWGLLLPMLTFAIRPKRSARQCDASVTNFGLCAQNTL